MGVAVRRWMLVVLACLGFSGAANAMPIYATSIVDSTVAQLSGANVLGAPDGTFTDFEDFNGAPGFVVVGFDGNLQNETGDDIFIHLVDWDPSETDEEFRVLASIDGSSFFLLGVSGPPTGGVNPAASVVGFDLADAGLTNANFVKVENLFMVDFQSGPDIDAIEGRFAVPEPSTTALLALGLLGVGFTRRRRAR